MVPFINVLSQNIGNKPLFVVNVVCMFSRADCIFTIPLMMKHLYDREHDDLKRRQFASVRTCLRELLR